MVGWREDLMQTRHQTSHAETGCTCGWRTLVFVRFFCRAWGRGLSLYLDASSPRSVAWRRTAGPRLVAWPPRISPTDRRKLNRFLLDGWDGRPPAPFAWWAGTAKGARWSSIRHPGGHLRGHGAACGGGMVALATTLTSLTYCFDHRSLG